MDLTNTLSLTIRENVNFSVSNFFTGWMNEIYDFEKKCVRKNFSSKTKSAFLMYYQEYSVLPMVAPDKKDTITLASNVSIPRPTKLFKIAGLMPTEIGDITADNDNGEPLEFTINFVLQQCDNIIIDKKVQDKLRQLGEKVPAIKFLSNYVSF